MTHMMYKIVSQGKEKVKPKSDQDSRFNYSFIGNKGDRVICQIIPRIYNEQSPDSGKLYRAESLIFLHKKL